MENFAENILTGLKKDLTFPSYYKDKSNDSHYCFLSPNRYIKAWVYGSIVHLESISGPFALSNFTHKDEYFVPCTPYEFTCVSDVAIDYINDVLKRK
jgi:hypothetical protein